LKEATTMYANRWFGISLVCAGALLSCTDASVTAPDTDLPAPTLKFGNGPAELFNVVRYSSDAGGFFIVDETSGLIVVEGLPTDPSTLYLCEGGTNPASTLTIQEVGWIRGVIHSHQVGEDVNIHIFRLSDVDFSFPGDPFLHLWCTGSPIAVGTGRAKAIDNDFFATGQKNNAIVFEIRGTVTELSTGELLDLKARAHIVQNVAGFPDVPATVKVSKTFVRLSPI
jgi:hypothetical protein